MNSHLFNLCPSQYEGWGHSIHEAMGVGAVVITSNAAPMNECGIHQELLIPSMPDKKMRLGTLCSVEPKDIALKVQAAASMTDEAINLISRHNREAFLSDREWFRRRLLDVAGTCARRFACAS